MQYNLVRNGYLSASGTVSLSLTELEKLKDGNTTSSGISITASGVLYLDLDMSQRIKVYDIRLYANDIGHSSNITFSYRNRSSEGFTDIVTSSGSSYYYTTIADPSAPRYLKVTVSGVDLDLYEFLVYSDDYIVAFGEDGTEYAKYLGNIPVGEESDPSAVAIYNNSDLPMPADAYVSVDYNGNPEDMYLEISSSQNGTYYALEDGALLQSNLASETYTWNMGEFDNTLISSNSLVVDIPTIENEEILLGDLPLLDGSESWNVGYRPWDYDSVNNLVYAIGTDATETSLWLYKYEVDSNTWSYIGEINPGLPAGFEGESVMCYVDGYVYVCCSHANLEFGRYDLSGPQDNWESLDSPPFVAYPRRLGIAFDQSEYIYMTHGNSEDISEFYRYSTISGGVAGWETLDNGYSRNGDSYGGYFRMSLTYDIDRDYIYMDNGRDARGSYIQRYIVSTDTWDTSYLDKNDGLGGQCHYMTIYYYKDYIVFFGDCYTPTFYLYHIPTNTVSEKSIGDPTINASSDATYVLPIDPVGDEFSLSILFSNIEGDRDGLYGYNIPYVPPSTAGTYTTPIFGLDNKYMASYFVIDGTATSGSGNISYDENTYNDTIRVRSSNTAPLEIEEIYWSVYYGRDINKYDLNTLEVDDPLSSLPNDGLNSAFSLAVDRRSGRVVAVYGRSGWSVTAFITIVDRLSGTDLAYVNGDEFDDYNFIEFDKNGGFWASNLLDRFYHYDYNESSSNIELVNNTTILGAVYAAVEMDGLGIWYIEDSTKSVYHLDYNCDILNILTFGGDLTAICGTLDNGCWIADSSVQKVYRYSYNASLVKTVSLSRDVDFMCDDKANGFWYASDNSVYHVDSSGNEDVDVYIGDIYRLHAGHNGCVVSSLVLDRIYYVDKNSNSITHEYAESDNNTGMAVVFSYNYDDYVEFKNNNDIYPDSDDPVWGPDGSLEWRVVSKDGYFLPKYKYHQAEITLRGQAEVDKVIMAPAVRVEDIQPGSYKNMYVKTNIPAGAEITDYSTNLKAWWDIEDN